MTVFIFLYLQKMHIGYYKFPRMILMFASLCGGAAVLSSFILGIDAYTGAVSSQRSHSLVIVPGKGLSQPCCVTLSL